jgi:acyl-CoA thioester hydrolase
MVAVERTVKYRRELLAGDIIAVRSSVIEVKDRTIGSEHEMRKADSGGIAATTTLTGVHIDTVVRRACAFPASVRRKGAALLARVDSLDAAPLRQPGA